MDDSTEHPLYNIVGLLDEEEAERVRSRVEAFRDEVEQRMDPRS